MKGEDSWNIKFCIYIFSIKETLTCALSKFFETDIIIFIWYINSKRNQFMRRILFQNLWEVEFPIIVRNERYLFIEMARRVAIKIFGREEIKSGLKVVTKSRDSSKIFDKLSRARYNFARVVRLLPIRGLNLCPSVSIRVVSRLAGARGG